MTLEQAYAMACHVRDEWPRLKVLAIGHFVPAENVREFTPWAVSVFDEDAGRPRLLRSESDLPRPTLATNKTKPKPANKSARPAPVPRSLFEVEGF